MRYAYVRNMVLCVIVLEATAVQSQSTIQSIAKNMVLVEGGSFVMGCTTDESDCLDIEKPTHTVTVSSFLISKFEITNAQYAAIMGTIPGDQKRLVECPTCPVDRTEWNIVMDFINKLNAKTGKLFRLPTEAEWEFAARGGVKSKGYRFSGSNDVNKVAWQMSNSKNSSHPVGSLLPNELGTYDMTGNVSEWCADWYGEDYYSKSVPADPKGPETFQNSLGEYKVTRGSSFNVDPKYCTVTGREGVHVSGNRDGASGVGFRLAMDIK